MSPTAYLVVRVDRRARYSASIIGALLMALLMLAGPVAPVAAAEGPNSLNGLSATYDVSATLKWRQGRLNVVSRATVSNNSDTPVAALTFNAAPAKIGRMVLGAVSADEAPATATVDDQNIFVELPAALEPSASTVVSIAYSAWFGGTSGNKQFLFAKVDGVATAYRWIPWLSRPYNFNTPTYGEPFVTKTADTVSVSITTDRPLVIAATGRKTGQNGLTQTFVASNVRDFNFSASPKYKVSRITWGKVAINFYNISLPIDRVKKWTLAAVNRFSNRIGAYPYSDLSVAQVPTGPSMESPGMVWLNGNSASRGTLKYLTVHELAHQWFYGVIGNDRASDPYADEALAEFLTRDFLGHRASKCATDMLDKRVYDYSAHCYYETVYVQGDRYLEAYRQQVGNERFWAGMRQYFADNRFGMGSSAKLWQTLDAAAGDAAPADHSGRFPSLYTQP